MAVIFQLSHLKQIPRSSRLTQRGLSLHRWLCTCRNTASCFPLGDQLSMVAAYSAPTQSYSLLSLRFRVYVTTTPSPVAINHALSLQRHLSALPKIAHVES